MIGRINKLLDNYCFPKGYNICEIEDHDGENHTAYISKDIKLNEGDIIRFKPLASSIRDSKRNLNTYLIIDSANIISNSKDYKIQKEINTYSFVLDEYLNLYYTPAGVQTLVVLTRAGNINLKRVPIYFRNEQVYTVLDLYRQGDRIQLKGFFKKYETNKRVDYKFIVKSILLPL